MKSTSCKQNCCFKSHATWAACYKRNLCVCIIY